MWQLRCYGAVRETSFLRWLRNDRSLQLLQVPDQDGGCLRPGGGATGAEGGLGNALDQALRHGPCHGDLGVGADAGGVCKGC